MSSKHKEILCSDQKVFSNLKQKEDVKLFLKKHNITSEIITFNKKNNHKIVIKTKDGQYLIVSKLAQNFQEENDAIILEQAIINHLKDIPKNNIVWYYGEVLPNSFQITPEVFEVLFSIQLLKNPHISYKFNWRWRDSNGMVKINIQAFLNEKLIRELIVWRKIKGINECIAFKDLKFCIESDFLSSHTYRKDFSIKFLRDQKELKVLDLRKLICNARMENDFIFFKKSPFLNYKISIVDFGENFSSISLNVTYYIQSHLQKKNGVIFNQKDKNTFIQMDNIQFTLQGFATSEYFDHNNFSFESKYWKRLIRNYYFVKDQTLRINFAQKKWNDFFIYNKTWIGMNNKFIGEYLKVKKPPIWFNIPFYIEEENKKLVLGFYFHKNNGDVELQIPVHTLNINDNWNLIRIQTFFALLHGKINYQRIGNMLDFLFSNDVGFKNIKRYLKRTHELNVDDIKCFFKVESIMKDVLSLKIHTIMLGDKKYHFEKNIQIFNFAKVRVHEVLQGDISISKIIFNYFKNMTLLDAYDSFKRYTFYQKKSLILKASFLTDLPISSWRNLNIAIEKANKLEIANISYEFTPDLKKQFRDFFHSLMMWCFRLHPFLMSKYEKHLPTLHPIDKNIHNIYLLE